MILHTGGRSLGATSTKSRPEVRAVDNASSVGRIPSWAPSALITRIGEIRICSLMRCCFSMAKKLQTRDGFSRAGWTFPRTLHHGLTSFPRLVRNEHCMAVKLRLKLFILAHRSSRRSLLFQYTQGAVKRSPCESRTGRACWQNYSIKVTFTPSRYCRSASENLAKYVDSTTNERLRRCPSGLLR